MPVTHAFVSLLTSDHYLPGALALVAALRDVHATSTDTPHTPSFDIVCLVTPETVDVRSIKLLRRAFDHVIGVEVIEQRSYEGLKLLGRLDLAQVLTKLHVFRLINYSKIVFLDADVLPLKPLSHLFSLPYEFAAAPDVGWPDIFNSGVMLLTPGQDKFDDIMALVRSKGSWDGGDQGVLNEWRGNDWHRLSFTYNTTPTAAYTYAPAYARFGTDIKAIHFIGPNKPWTSLSYRAPYSPSSLQNIASQPQTYGYGALLDRWYAVYDKHYRSQESVSEQEYEVRKYESIWNAQQAQPSLPAPLGLEELKQMAIQGTSAIPTNHGSYRASHYSSEPSGAIPLGEYKSMPLEGRFDLMRPRAPLPEPEVTESGEGDGAETPKASQQSSLAIPSEGPRVAPFSPADAPDATAPTPAPVPVPAYVSFPTSVPSAQGFIPPPLFSPLTAAQQELHAYQPMLPPPAHAPLPERQPSPPRPRSPPMMVWNPSVDPPPSDPPPQSAFQPDEHFENVWDAAPSGQHHGSQEDSRGFFIAPPLSKIPSRLIEEGHYSNVVKPMPPPPAPAKPKESQPSAPVSVGFTSPAPQKAPTPPYDPHRPDKSKVASVFPWETKARTVPGRIFPRSASPPPPSTIFAPQKPATPPAEPEQLEPSPPIPSPPASNTYLGAVGFQNAWDAVPSITRYATRLQRQPPTPPPTFMQLQQLQSVPKGRRSRRGSSATYKSWEELADTSSHEGDDEDEGDDLDDDSPDSPARGGRAQGVSRSSISRDERTGKTYRSQSVQTRRQIRHEASVQTPPISPPTQSPPPTTAVAVQERPPKPIMSIAGLTSNSLLLRKDSSSMGTPTVDEPQEFLHSNAGRKSLAASKDPNRTPRGGALPLMRKNSTSPPVAASNASATKVAAKTGPPMTPPLLLRSSDETLSLSSSQASQELMSPKDGQPLLSPVAAQLGPSPVIAPVRRPAGRAWDPARGVDVFKSQSEEVLARFLKMGSWDDNN